MTSFAKWFRQGASSSERNLPLSMDEWVSWFSYQGLQYPSMPRTTLGQTTEEITSSFQGYVEQIYKSNGPIFACMAVRLLLFSEARFQFRQIQGGRPGDLFGTKALDLLVKPWPNGTTRDLLKRAIQDTDLSGNFYVAREGKVLRRLRPDWVTIVLGSKKSSAAGDDSPNWYSDAEVIGYGYHPGGPGSGADPEVFLVNQVAHFAPYTDPIARFRGMSWLTPIIREIQSDGAATTHKLKFFEQGATANMVVSLDPAILPEQFTQFVEKFEEAHEGVMNAYKTMYLGGGADVKVVGANMQQLEFKVTQGAGETRICAAARVPPVVAGFSEGLQAATYSNYGQARRHFADGTLRPMWGDFASALAPIVDVPRGSELYYDDRDIPFLAEDVKDSAEILQMKSVTAQNLIASGFDPNSVIDAIESEDFSRLSHTGLVSVQLQPPGSDPTANGNGVSAVGSKSLLPANPYESRCSVCSKGGPGMTVTRSGRPVHRWPCLGMTYEVAEDRQKALPAGDS